GTAGGTVCGLGPGTAAAAAPTAPRDELSDSGGRTGPGRPLPATAGLPTAVELFVVEAFAEEDDARSLAAESEPIAL
ncbi:hypothetical protein B8W95_13735, partial [Staphylococcus pasteuri]